MVGVVGLYGRELRNLSKKAEDWPFSVWMLIVTTLFIVVGVTFGYQDERYQWIYNSVLLPLSATMYGSISFYIAAASYRVLRFKSKEATVLLIPAAILLFANTPLITSLWEGFSTAGSWIMKHITQSSYRGIMIGTALGTLATGLRILAGRETGWLGRKEAEE